MALTLDATLAAAQDSQSRKPLVEITSSQRESDIPFDGTFLTRALYDEYGANVIPHSTGRLCIAYCYGQTVLNKSGIQFFYTDTNRVEFINTEIELFDDSRYEMVAVSLCELSGGNVGLVYLYTYSSSYYLSARIVTVTGTAVSGPHAIGNWATSVFTSDPWVCDIGGTYTLFYAKQSGSDYYIYKRTSADFETWSAEAAQTIGGITTTYKLRNPSIAEISTGDLWLFFDALEGTGGGGEELTNIYYSISDDSGATWADAVQLTSYDSCAEIGNHPVAIQKVASTLNVVFNNVVGALHMDKDTTGWASTGYYADYSYELSWDSTNRKLFVVNYGGGVIERLESIIKIDVDTWSIDKYWDHTTVPAFPSWMCNNTGTLGDWDISKNQTVQDGPYLAVFTYKRGYRAVWYLDTVADTITAYYFDDIPTKTITANFDASGLNANHDQIYSCVVDKEHEKIWLLFLYYPGGSPGDFTGRVSVGYIDLTETTDPELHIVVDYVNCLYLDNVIQFGDYSAHSGMTIDYESNVIVITQGSSSSTSTSFCGACVVFDESGSLIQSWNGRDNATNFPYHGIGQSIVVGGKIYAGMTSYYIGAGQSSMRGLVELDISSGDTVFHRPTYCTEDYHAFGRPTYLENGIIAMTHNSRTAPTVDGEGVALFNTVSKTWTIYSNSNVPGLTLDGADDFGRGQIVYDSTDDMIMVGDVGDGVLMFSRNGYIRRAYQIEAADSGGGFVFGDESPLVQGYLDYDCGVCKDQDSTSMYAFWTNEKTTTEQSIKWDRDGSDTDITPYIVSGQDVTVTRTIDGTPSMLSFTVSHGHLFDNYNITSLLSPVLKKGRKLSLRWGEDISGTEYWHNAGDYYVTDTRTSLQRGKYPTMTVMAEDQRCLWRFAHIDATDTYNNTPKQILDDILEDVAGIDPSDLNIPVFVGSTNLEHQWIDIDLLEVIDQICNRFGYFFRFDVDGKAHARQISDELDTDHTYSDNTKIINFSQDDKYSDFTNRVTVEGQERDFTQVTFEEERVGMVSGTLGWWGCEKDHKLWFSEDKSRRCINPRMEVIETSMSIPMRLAGSTNESLRECDPEDDNKFCVVEVEAPNLIPVILADITLLLGNAYVGNVAPPFGGMTKAVGRIIERGLLATLFSCLGSVANYQIAVWAQPLGQIRRSVQGRWDDVEHQTEINTVVARDFEDPLCYSASDCIAVATFEGTVARLQRNRVMFSKVAHLQDEEGDTISIIHPYGGQAINLYVTDITRRFKKATLEGKSGYFIDDINAWVLD